jgi:hypothetical protein
VIETETLLFIIGCLILTGQGVTFYALSAVIKNQFAQSRFIQTLTKACLTSVKYIEQEIDRKEKENGNH